MSWYGFQSCYYSIFNLVRKINNEKAEKFGIKRRIRDLQIFVENGEQVRSFDEV